MKITRKQLRRVIKEAMDQESKDIKDLEAHYAITYAQVYIVMYKDKLDRESQAYHSVIVIASDQAHHSNITNHHHRLLCQQFHVVIH